MSNTVQANIEVNGRINISDIEKGLKDLASDFYDIGGDIEKYINDPAKISMQTFNDLEKESDALAANFTALHTVGRLDSETFQIAKDSLSEINEKIESLKGSWIEINNQQERTEDTFQNIISDINDFQNKISETLSNNDMSGADKFTYLSDEIKNIYNSLNNITDVIPEQAFDRAMQGLLSLDEQIKSLGSGLISSDILDISDSLRNIGSELQTYVMNPLSATDEELGSIKNEINDTLYKLLDLKGSINDDQYNRMFAGLEGQLAKINEIIDLRGIEIDRIKIASDYEEERAANIQKVIDAFNETFVKPYENNIITEKDVENLNKLLEAEQKLNDETFKSNIGKNFNIDEGVKLSEEALETLQESVEETANDAGNSIDSIGKKFEANGDVIIDVLGNLAGASGLSSGEVTKLAGALGATGPAVALVAAEVGASIAVLKLYTDLIKKCTSDITNMLKVFGDGAVNGIDLFVDGLNELCDITDDAIKKLQEFADKGADIQDAYFSLYNVLGTKGGDALSGFADNLEKLYGLDATGAIADMNSLFGLTAKLSNNVNEVTSATESLYLMAQGAAKVYNKELTRVISDLKIAINRGNLRAGNVIFDLLDESEIAEFKKLNSAVERTNYLLTHNIELQAAFEQYLDTEAGKIYILKQQWNSFLGNLGQLALGIYAKVAPLLTNLLKIANAVVTALMKVFNINVTTETTKGSNLEGYLSDVEDQFNDTKKAAKEAEKQVASFDDVIQINDSKSDDNDAFGLNNLSGDGFNSGWLDDFADKAEKARTKLDDLIDLIKDGKWVEAAKLADEMFKDFLENIPWDEYKKKAREIGNTLADVFNVFVDDMQLWKDLGHTAAEALNTVAELLYSFGKEFHWENLGKGLMTSWNEFWQTMDGELIGKTLYEYIMGAFEVLYGMVKEGDTSAGSKMGEILNTFFGEITDEDIEKIADGVIGAITWIFNNIEAFMKTISEGDGKEKIEKIISKLMEDFANDSGYWGKTLGNVIKTVLDFVYETLVNADKSGLTDGIAKFLAGLDLKGIFDRWFNIQLELIWLVIETAIKTLIEDIKNRITGETETSSSDVEEGIFTILEGLIGNLAFRIGEFIGLKIVETGEEQFETLNEEIDKIWKGIEEFFDPEKWGQMARDAMNGLFNGLKEIWNKIKEWWNTNVGGRSIIDLAIPDWIPVIGGKTWDFKIPKLAVGGVVDKATVAMIGEAGREAVMPLDRNTGWMDELASKISNNSNTNNSAPVVIDMSKVNKPVYTRSEYLALADVFAEAMKARGMVVSMEY